ncbi:helix-turn-helix domain-containing protein [Streptomyces sp. NPDC058171]
MPRRQLGRSLRRLRVEAGMTVRAAAAEFEWSEVKIWRIETGKTPVHAFDVEGMCRAYGASKEITQALVSLVREAKTPAWWQSYGDVTPGGWDVFAGMEGSASHVDTYEPDLVPGLLQTDDYVREIVHAHHPDLPDSEVDVRVRFRAERQNLLTGDRPPMMRVAISETVVRRIIGGRAAMARQLAHLVYMGRLPGLAIRVVPLSVGPHPGVISGAFVVMRFPLSPAGVQEPTTVYGDTFTGGYYLDKDREVQQYEQAFTGIWLKALDEESTRRLLADAAKTMGES